MAEKKVKVDDFDFDSELDSFMFDEPSNKNPKKKSKKDRSATFDFVEGVGKGAYGVAKDPSFLKGLAKSAIPRDYKVLVDSAGKMADTLSSLYDDASKKLKPDIQKLAKKVDRLVPEEKKTLKKLTTKFKDFVGEESSYTAMSPEAVQTQTINNELGRLFQVQAQINFETDVRNKAEARVNDAINTRRFNLQTAVMGRIDQNITHIRAYNDNIDLAWKKKSIELQYRQLFTQNQLLKVTADHFAIFKQQFDNIQMNSGLPDFAKMQGKEFLKQQAFGKSIGKVSSTLFSDNRIMDVAMKRLKDKVNEQINGFRDGLQAAVMAVDEYESSKQQMDEARKMAEELGMDFDEGTKAGTAGTMMGGMLGTKLGEMLANFAGEKFNKDSKLGKKLYSATKAARNISGTANKLKNHQKLTDLELKGDMGAGLADIARGFLDLFSSEGADMKMASGRRTRDLLAPAMFTRKVELSQTEVIPGLLARILRETTAARLGTDNVPLTVYDYRSGRFVTQTNMAKDVKDMLKAKAKRFGHAMSLKDTTDFIFKDQNASEDVKQKSKKFINRIAMKDNQSYDPEDLYDTDEFKALDKETQDALKAALDKNVTGAKNRQHAESRLTDKIADVRDYMPDMRATIEEMIAQGHVEILEKEGIIKFDKEGNYEIDKSRYLDLVESQNLVTSDVRAKRGIHKVNPKDALKKVRKTRVYDWIYKKGRGDKKRHTGPMAQDVNKNMGEETAPDGTKIDLTSMNGHTMAAIQELANNQDAAKDKGFLKVLREIKEDTGMMVGLLASGGSGEGGSFYDKAKADAKDAYERAKSGAKGAYDKAKAKSERFKYKNYANTGNKAADFFSNLIINGSKFAADGAEALFEGLKVGGKNVKDKHIDPSAKYMKDMYKDNKDEVKERIKDLFVKATNMAGDVLTFGKRMVDDKLPEAIKKLKAMGMKGYEFVMDQIYEQKDVYVKGAAEPALRAHRMKQGMYFDAKTKTVLKSIHLINGPVVDQDGNMVLTNEDLDKGLVDSEGKPFRTRTRRAIDYAIHFAKKGLGMGRGAIDAMFPHLKKLGGTLWNGLGDITEAIKKHLDEFGFSIGFGDKKIHDVLVDIRNILSTRLPSNGMPDPEPTNTPIDSFVVNGAKDIKKKTAESKRPIKQKKSTARDPSKIRKGPNMTISSITGENKEAEKTPEGFLSGLFGKAKGLFGKKSKDDKDPKSGGLLSGLFGKAKNIFGKKKDADEGKEKPAFNDRDGSGKRDGAAEDRLKKQEEETKNRKLNTAAVDTTAKYKSDNVFDTIFSKAGSLFSMLSSGASSMFGGVGSLVSGIGNILGVGKTGGILSMGAKVLGGAMKLGGNVLSGGFNLAKGVLTGGKAIGTVVNGASKLGPVMSVLNTVRTGMMVGSLATGGVASTVLSAGTALLTTITAAISWPVVLGAVAVAATGYGVYRGYKALTKNNIDKFTTIRMRQYGLKGDSKSKSHYGDIVQLEGYLLDGKVGFNNGQAYIMEKKIKAEEILAILGIDKEDEDGVTNFLRWFNKRFKPFFIHHVTTANAVDPKVKLNQIGEKFKAEQKVKYLRTAGYDSGPYNEDMSPFKDIEALDVDPTQAKALIEELIDENNKLLAKEEDDAIRNRKRDKEPPSPPKKSIDQRMKEYDKSGESKKLTTSNKPDPLPGGEEGSAPKSTVDISSGGGTGKLAMANGPMSDGSKASQYIKAGSNVDLTNLNPSLKTNLYGMIQEYGELTGKSTTINSAARTREEQERLYKQDPTKAAKPGTSIHESGLAIDIDSAVLNEMEKLGLMRKYGFTRPVGQEPWHMEPAGIQVNLGKAVKDENYANQLVAASLGKGGGGYGTLSNANKGKRDSDLALSILDGSSSKVDNSKMEDKQLASVTPSNNVVNLDEERKRRASDSGFQKASYTAPSDDGGNKVKSSGSSGGSGESKAAGGSGMPDSKVPDNGTGTGNDMAKPSTNEDKSVGGIIRTIESSARKTGADPDYMKTIAMSESGLKPYARASTSSAEGLFQLTRATWDTMVDRTGKKHGIDSGDSPSDPVANSLMGGELISMEQKAVKQQQPKASLVDVYLAHFLGLGGVKPFLKADGNAIGADIAPKAAAANKSIFYDKSGRARTVAEIYDLMAAKLRKSARFVNADVGKIPTFAERGGAGTSSTTSESGNTDSQKSGMTSTSSTTASTLPTGGSVAPQQRAPQEPERMVNREKASAALQNTSNVPSVVKTSSDNRAVNTTPDTILDQKTMIGLTEKLVDVNTKHMELTQGIFDLLKRNADKSQAKPGEEKKQQDNSMNDRPRSLPKPPIDVSRRIAA